MLILTVSIGVGLMLIIAMLRIIFKVKLKYLLIFFYAIVFGLIVFVPENFIPMSFDSGGVTTGPMTVPFIMALGVGVASIRSDDGAEDDSFGLVALCSIGPILAGCGRLRNVLGAHVNRDHYALCKRHSSLSERGRYRRVPDSYILPRLPPHSRR